MAPRPAKFYHVLGSETDSETGLRFELMLNCTYDPGTGKHYLHHGRCTAETVVLDASECFSIQERDKVAKFVNQLAHAIARNGPRLSRLELKTQLHDLANAISAGAGMPPFTFDGPSFLSLSTQHMDWRESIHTSAAPQCLDNTARLASIMLDVADCMDDYAKILRRNGCITTTDVESREVMTEILRRYARDLAPDTNCLPVIFEYGNVLQMVEAARLVAHYLWLYFVSSPRGSTDSRPTLATWLLRMADEIAMDYSTGLSLETAFCRLRCSEQDAGGRRMTRNAIEEPLISRNYASRDDTLRRLGVRADWNSLNKPGWMPLSAVGSLFYLRRSTIDRSTSLSQRHRQHRSSHMSSAVVEDLYSEIRTMQAQLTTLCQVRDKFPDHINKTSAPSSTKPEHGSGTTTPRALIAENAYDHQSESDTDDDVVTLDSVDELDGTVPLTPATSRDFL